MHLSKVVPTSSLTAKLLTRVKSQHHPGEDILKGGKIEHTEEVVSIS